MSYRYPKEPIIFIEHIVQCIEDIKSYTKDVEKEEFFENTQKQDAVVRKIEIIGEAVKNLPESIRKKYPEIPWKSIAGMRDILIHEYFNVDLKYAWKVVKMEIPKLERQIKNLLKDIMR